MRGSLRGLRVISTVPSCARMAQTIKQTLLFFCHQVSAAALHRDGSARPSWPWHSRRDARPLASPAASACAWAVDGRHCLRSLRGGSGRRRGAECPGGLTPAEEEKAGPGGPHRAETLSARPTAHGQDRVPHDELPCPPGTLASGCSALGRTRRRDCWRQSATATSSRQLLWPPRQRHVSLPRLQVCSGCRGPQTLCPAHRRLLEPRRGRHQPVRFGAPPAGSPAPHRPASRGPWSRRRVPAASAPPTPVLHLLTRLLGLSKCCSPSPCTQSPPALKHLSQDIWRGPGVPSWDRRALRLQKSTDKGGGGEGASFMCSP